MNIDLKQRIIAVHPPRPRLPKRYAVGDIYPLLKGWLTPEEYLTGNRKPFIDELTSCCNMDDGTASHIKVQNWFPEVKKEEKLEYKWEDLTIVGIYDLMVDGEIWDLKTSRELIEAKPWSIFQLKCYLTMFEVEVGRLYQPREETEQVMWRGKKRTRVKRRYLKELGTYKRNDKWFAGVMEDLKKKDKLISKHYEERNKSRKKST